ncbi:MAG: hypothetical protein A3F68_01405 [Acidobacteria bacterium RIFCSPLOWO2_12_FULL_54_10]|nr:MAG: hypothetical protein A3F68_01405 [Acidobacteria bacterium RIFCSPLOWO2_12_FULL_54_10]
MLIFGAPLLLAQRFRGLGGLLAIHGEHFFPSTSPFDQVQDRLGAREYSCILWAATTENFRCGTTSPRQDLTNWAGRFRLFTLIPPS